MAKKWVCQVHGIITISLTIALSVHKSVRVLENHPGDAKLQTAYFLVTSSYVFVLAIKPDILFEYHAAKG